MSDIEFNSDNEEIQKLARLVVGLQQQLIRLAQRQEVDMLMISSLLDHSVDYEELLGLWRSKAAEYYPSKALSNLADSRLQATSDELNHRIGVWTKALEQRARPSG